MLRADADLQKIPSQSQNCLISNYSHFSSQFPAEVCSSLLVSSLMPVEQTTVFSMFKIFVGHFSFLSIRALCCLGSEMGLYGAIQGTTPALAMALYSPYQEKNHHESRKRRKCCPRHVHVLLQRFAFFSQDLRECILY